MDLETFLEQSKFYRTPDNQIARLLRKDKFYVDLELATKEEISYQLTQVTPIIRLTDEEKDEWVLEYMLAHL